MANNKVEIVKDAKKSELFSHPEYQKYKNYPHTRFNLACSNLNKVIKKDARGHISQYCTLNNLLDKVYDIFPKLGISVVQRFGKDSDNNLIITEVLDISNPKTDSTYSSQCPVIQTSTIILPKPEPIKEVYDSESEESIQRNQLKDKKNKKRYRNLNYEFGASVTYYRRYCLFVVLGIFPDMDTDGIASAPMPSNKSKTPSPTTIAEVIEKIAKGRYMSKKFFNEGKDEDGRRVQNKVVEYIEIFNNLNKETKYDLEDLVKRYNKKTYGK